MTPKYKANELLFKMHNLDFHDLPDELAMQYIYAKQCAIIAVDEIINNYEDRYKYCNSKIYWQEVKQEIEKL
jgi:hypothetical protein